ncbi:hypothetical protein [Caenispirillum bisanense]|uniref:hypothetical protein n=1 Tax=Caenispirillum bisanense TaxID=414052 RepID=UPI0031CE2942
MWEWFWGLAVISKLWIVYLMIGGSVAALAVAVEAGNARRPNKDGSGGWFLFGAIMILGYGFLLTLLLSAVIWLVQLVVG